MGLNEPPSEVSGIDDRMLPTTASNNDEVVGFDESLLEHKQVQAEVENTAPMTSDVDDAQEYEISTRKKYSYLAAYFVANLSLTLLNKVILQKFPFPWLLTTVHATAVSIGCYTMLKCGVFKTTKLHGREHLILLAFSVLFTVNIAMSNISLALVSVPFHQVMRSICPVITVFIYRTFFHRGYATQTYLSLLVVILGVALTTYGDYYFTLLGFTLTLTGVVLASMKTIVTNQLLTGNLSLPVFELLLRMSPLAALQSLLIALLTGEVSKARPFLNAKDISPTFGLVFAVNAILALVLNIVSFQANKVAGALTMAVCGNLKQMLSVLLGVVLFNLEVSLLNGAGMITSLAGAAWYSKAELEGKSSNLLSRDGCDIEPKSWTQLSNDIVRKWVGSSKIYSARFILGSIYLIVLIAIMTWTMMTNTSESITVQHSTSSRAPELHLVVPATSSNFNLCQLLFSTAVLGYPTPTIINWGANSDIPHTEKVFPILAQLEQWQENDIVLIVDGYDVWFQLAPEVLLQRYFDANEAANERLRQEFGPHLVQRHNIQQTIVFAADKLCWPAKPRRPACWAVLDSTLASDAFGPETDRGDMMHDRPRWLNSGTVIGPVRDLKTMFKAFTKDLDMPIEPEYHGSDQMYLGDLQGRQDFSRFAAAQPDYPTYGNNRIWSERELPRIEASSDPELHIGLDYESTLFFGNAGYQAHLSWLVHGTQQPQDYSVASTPNGSRSIDFPADLLQSQPPKDFLGDIITNADLEAAPSSSWLDVPLGTNVITGQIFASIHFTGSKELRELWWSRMWFFPRAKERLRFASLKGSQTVTGPIGGQQFWWPLKPKGAQVGSAVSDNDVVLPWNEICKEHEPALFGETPLEVNLPLEFLKPVDAPTTLNATNHTIEENLQRRKISNLRA